MQFAFGFKDKDWFKMWRERELNSCPRGYESDALTS